MFTFATNLQFFVYYDWRWVVQNIWDSQPGQQLPNDGGYADISSQSGLFPYYMGATLATMLGAASEELMSAAAVGARYSPNDIQQFGGNLAIKIVSGLTVGPIVGRRVRSTKVEEDYAATWKFAQEQIEALRKGERIFAFVPNVPQAGLPTTAPQRNAMSPPTWKQQACRLFGLPAVGPGGSCGCEGG